MLIRILTIIQFISVIDTPVLGVESFTYTANISQDVTLYCELLFGTQVTGLYWQQDNKNLTAASFSDKYRSATKEMPSLTIRNVTYADAGTYSCHAVNYVGTGRSPDTQLNVIARVEGGRLIYLRMDIFLISLHCIPLYCYPNIYK